MFTDVRVFSLYLLRVRHKMKHNYDKFGLKYFSEMNELINNKLN